MNVFTIGLAILTSIFPGNNSSQIAESIQHATKNKIQSDTLIKEAFYVDSLFSEERYLNISYLDSGYAIYDILYEQIMEIRLDAPSPFENKRGYELVYAGPWNYLYFSSGALHDLTNDMKLSSKQIADVCDYQERIDYNLAKGNEEKRNPLSLKMSSYSSLPLACTMPNSYYLENLRRNFGNNALGSCGYVAIQILLSYYDIFFDDRIIDEEFELKTNISHTNSPGTNNEYHQELISLGQSLGIGFGTDNVNRKDILRQYLANQGFYENSDYTLHSTDGNLADMISGRAKKLIRQAVCAGEPVIVGGELPTGGNHAWVVYGYDGNMVYGNSGWIDSTELIINFSCIDRTIDIDWINSQHVHSDSYVNGDIFYCACGAFNTGAHCHTYLNYLKVTNNFHNSTCWCGYQIQELHDQNLYPFVTQCICGHTTGRMKIKEED